MHCCCSGAVGDAARLLTTAGGTASAPCGNIVKSSDAGSGAQQGEYAVRDVMSGAGAQMEALCVCVGVYAYVCVSV